jgi:hypothetical protein
MTKVLFLHAGPPKTGSTTIQQFFRDNADLFARQGLLRPRTGTAHRSHYHFDLVEAFSPERTADPLRAALKAEIEENGRPDRVFISAEHFAAKLGTAAYLASLTTFCRELGYRLQVIAYVRPPAALLNSLYTQSVKSWRQVPFIDQFVAREIGGGRHDYMRLFAALRRNGDASLTLRPFNREVLARGLTIDMCGIMGLATEGEALADSGEEANVSPGPMTVAAFERLRRRVSREFPDLTRDDLAPLTWPLVRAAGAEGWNEEKYGGLTPESARRIEAAFRESNRELARLHWQREWDHIFSEKETAAPPYNVFDPAEVPQRERRAFRDFVEGAMEMVENVARLHQGQPSRR